MPGVDLVLLVEAMIQETLTVVLTEKRKRQKEKYQKIVKE
jgi:hypothetical protein